MWNVNNHISHSKSLPRNTIVLPCWPCELSPPRPSGPKAVHTGCRSSWLCGTSSGLLQLTKTPSNHSSPRSTSCSVLRTYFQNLYVYSYVFICEVATCTRVKTHTRTIFLCKEAIVMLPSGTYFKPWVTDIFSDLSTPFISHLQNIPSKTVYHTSTNQTSFLLVCFWYFKTGHTLFFQISFDPCFVSLSQIKLLNWTC